MKVFIVLLALVSASLATSEPVKTSEDAFFQSFSSEEREIIFGLAISDQNFESLLQQIRLPSLMEKLKRLEIPHKFQENVIQWLKRTFQLGDENVVELRTTLKTCNQMNCIDFGDIANRCCPFG